MARTKHLQQLAEDICEEIEEQRAADTSTLAQLNDLQAVMQTFLQHETLRVEAERGADDAYAVALREAEAAGVEEIDLLNAELDVSRIRVPVVGDDGALVDGRLLDAGGRGLAGLVVCLVDRASAPLARVDPATTDPSGYFAFAIAADSSEQSAQGKTLTASVAVFDSSGRPLHRDKRSLELGPGARHRVEITLGRVGGGGPASPRPTAPRRTKGPKRKTKAAAKKRAKKAKKKTAKSTSPTPAAVDTVVTALAAAVGFAEIGASAAKLRRRLAAMEVVSIAAAAALLERADGELRDALGLRNLKSARAFKRTLAIVVKDLGESSRETER